jgi:hypothetical protein
VVNVHNNSVQAVLHMPAIQAALCHVRRQIQLLWEAEAAGDLAEPPDLHTEAEAEAQS